MRARCQATPDSDVRAWRCSLLSFGTYQGPLIELGLNLVIVSCTLKTVRVGVAALSLHKRPVGTRVRAPRSSPFCMLNYVQQTPGEKRKREEDPNVRRARPSCL